MSPKPIALVLLTMWMAACSGQEGNPSIVFHGEGCAYSGPQQVGPAFTVEWTVEETMPLTAILEVVTLDAGYTVDDLTRIPAVDPPPPWVHMLSYGLASVPGTTLQDFDLRPNAAYAGGPIYFLCLSSVRETALGALGPIEVAD